MFVFYLVCLLNKLALLWLAVRGEEFFSSIESLRVLHESESVLISALESYLVDHTKIFVLLNKQLQKCKESHNDNNKSVENPIEAFKLIKRLVLDWGKTEQLSSKVKIFQRNNFVAEFPSLQDLEGSAGGLALVQHVYNLNIQELAKGSILGVQSYNEITWDDCLIIGRELYRRKEFKQSEMWFELVANIDSNKIQILEYLALVKCKLGKASQCQALLEELWLLNPEYEPSSELHSDYNNAVIGHCTAVKFNNWTQWIDDYQYSLCRGKTNGKLTEALKASLKCRYVDSNSYFLKLAPLKMEELFLDPPVKLFHNVIYDKEIQDLQSKAVKTKQRSKVFDGDDGIITTARVSQHAWLDLEHMNHLQIHRRIEDITGLSQEFSEYLQVNNYGIGGEYLFHVDAFHDDYAAKQQGGNRIATLLFYLSDVEIGGATVFTNLTLTVYPSKGSALFWYNLDNSCKSDTRSEHAACPVVVGSKWVANKWIREASQLFRKPCLPQTKPSI